MRLAKLLDSAMADVIEVAEDGSLYRIAFTSPGALGMGINFAESPSFKTKWEGKRHILAGALLPGEGKETGQIKFARGSAPGRMKTERM